MRRNDITYYNSDPFPMQVAFFGKTVHVFRTDRKQIPLPAGVYVIRYGKTTRKVIIR